jgi:twitching motility protein PilT
MAMDHESEVLIRAALKNGYITSRQAEMLRDEMDMFPGQNLGTLLVRRNLLTHQQLQILKTGHQGLKSVNSPAPSGVGTMPPPLRPTSSSSSSGSAAKAGAESKEPPPAAPQLFLSKPIPMPAPTNTRPGSSFGDYLRLARECSASDLHLCAGRSPFVRQGGKLVYLDEPPLTPEQSQRLNTEMLTSEQLAVLDRDQQIDFSLSVPGLGRQRCNVFESRDGIDGSYRIVRNKVPSLEDLGLPEVCKKLTAHQGLILVTGPCSSGKTTTCAALLQYINESREEHIITVEDPIEYIIPSRNCQVTQREVGHHTASFATALRGALRQDPDIVFVGEMRDFETTSIAISASETGHLVLGTLHTNSAIRAVARIMDLYPPSQRAQICVMVSESMRGVIAQQLIPRRDQPGLALALEILIFHLGVAAVIREGKTSQLPSLMQSGKRYGMKMMDESLQDLQRAGIISGRNAFLRADNKALFESVKTQD